MKILICLLLLICTGCGQTKKATIVKEPTLPIHIIMSTDFHLQQSNLEQQSTLVKEMKYNILIIQSFIDRVIESKPDVLLLCGDNTNNGIYADHVLLINELTRVKDAGIKVVIVPGNHDLYQVTRDEYHELYQSLLSDVTIHEDPNSLSYVAKLQDNMWLLVLDDLVDNTTGGSFTNETLNWMESVLIEAEEKGITVLSSTHHNLLTSSLEKYVNTYLIATPDALKLLKKYGVFVNFSGHRHTMQTALDDVFIEIVGSMLINYPASYHSIHLDQNNLSIQTKPFSLSTKSLPSELMDFDAYVLKNKKDSIQYTLDLSLKDLNLSREETIAMHEIFELVSLNYSSGTLGDIQDEAKRHKGYMLWQSKAPNTTWAPWLKYLVEQKQGNDSNITFKIPTSSK